MPFEQCIDQYNNVQRVITDRIRDYKAGTTFNGAAVKDLITDDYRLH